jgi:uncharacterized protein YndB with AHSA1/START domain
MTNGPIFTISRVFNAPPDRVWQAWTEPNSIAAWLGPKGSLVHVVRHKLEVGGSLHSHITTEEGTELWGKFTYREITAPSRLVWGHCFADKDGNIVRHPWSPTWPLEMLTTVTFEKVMSDKTKVTLTWVPVASNDAECKTFSDGMSDMQAGWGGSFDRLEALLAKSKSPKLQSTT